MKTDFTKNPEGVFDVIGIDYDYLEWNNDRPEVYKAEEGGIMVAYLESWKWKDGIITYTVYDSKNRLIADVAVIRKEKYQIVTRITL